MKKYFTILFIGLVQTIYAQHTINGTITDASTKEPLAGVDVYIPSLHKGTTSDFDGNFTLKDVPTKNVKLVISLIRI